MLALILALSACAPPDQGAEQRSATQATREGATVSTGDSGLRDPGVSTDRGQPPSDAVIGNEMEYAPASPSPAGGRDAVENLVGR